MTKNEALMKFSDLAYLSAKWDAPADGPRDTELRDEAFKYLDEAGCTLNQNEMAFATAYGDLSEPIFDGLVEYFYPTEAEFEAYLRDSWVQNFDKGGTTDVAAEGVTAELGAN